MMIVRKGGAASAAPVTFGLGHGAVLTARVLDAFEHKLLLAEARAELNALVAGEDVKYAWASFDAARLARLRTSEEARMAALGWMHAVLMASACATALDGVEEVETDADGAIVTRAPLAPSFATFELLFNDAGVEAAFRLQAFKVEQIWSAEKNVSGPGPNGSGPEEQIIAAPAAQQAMLAPAAANEATEVPAPSSPTLPELERESLPGISPAAAAVGSSQD